MEAVQELFSADITGIGLRSSDIITWEGEDITVIRVGRTSEYGYVIMASVEKAKEIYRLMREGEWDFPVKEGGLDALELAMLEVHQPNFIRETEEFGDIFELAQQWYIQYDKEDYTGWERLMEKFSNGVKKGAVGFSAAADSELPAGCEVTDGTDTIGRVVYGRYSYKLEKFLGIAVLDNPYAEAGLKLTAKGTNGDEEINTLSGPFIRPLSWDMKME